MHLCRHPFDHSFLIDFHSVFKTCLTIVILVHFRLIIHARRRITRRRRPLRPLRRRSGRRRLGRRLGQHRRRRRPCGRRHRRAARADEELALMWMPTPLRPLRPLRRQGGRGPPLASGADKSRPTTTAPSRTATASCPSQRSIHHSLPA